MLTPLRPSLRLALRATATATRGFSSTPTPAAVRIFDPITRGDDFHTTTRLATTANTPLITFWTASFCPSCRSIKPKIMEYLENRDEGLPDIMFCEVELDAQGGNVAELGGRYMISTLPTLLSFQRGEPVQDSRWTDIRAMSKKERIAEWIEEQAKGKGATGNISFGGLFR